jgi:hypothetical protein
VNLPQPVAEAVTPLFDKLPLARAMESLVVREVADDGVLKLAEQAAASPAFQARPALQAGIWLYVDELDRSHEISQGLKDATGSFWHGIMHRREGDFGNSHYWFNRTGHHPAMDAIDGYDPHAFIDDVAARHASNPPDLADRQRAEWAALFEWCAANSS